MSAATLVRSIPSTGVPPQLLVVGAAVSLQTGSAVATHVFAMVGAPGLLALRMGFAALVLLALGRAWRHRPRGRALQGVLAFGAVLGSMNLLFYLALERIPLGVTVALELLGPLSVALVASRRRADLGWVAMAALGVVVLTNPSTSGLDPVGVALALAAGACWAGYILVGSRVARRIPGTTGLAWAMSASCLVLLPLGVVDAGTALLDPGVVLAGIGVAMLSSVLPYALELKALRRVTPRGFGIMLSMQPGVATLAGLVVAGQRPSLAGLAGIALVVGASLGAVPARGSVAAETSDEAALEPSDEAGDPVAADTSADHAAQVR
jgi:inner membrane transporter RhtA